MPSRKEAHQVFSVVAKHTPSASSCALSQNSSENRRRSGEGGCCPCATTPLSEIPDEQPSSRPALPVPSLVARTIAGRKARASSVANPGYRLSQNPVRTSPGRRIALRRRVSIPSKPNIKIQTVDPPFPLSQQSPEPLQPEPGPLHPGLRHLFRRGRRQRPRRRVDHVHHDRRGRLHLSRCRRVAGARGVRKARAGSRLEPVAAKVEEASVGPVARGQEEDEEEDGAVEAWSVEEVGADEEEEDEGGRGVGRDEEEGEPAGGGTCQYSSWV